MMESVKVLEFVKKKEDVSVKKLLSETVRPHLSTALRVRV